MSKVTTFSRVFPSYHPRKGEPTYFVEKMIQWYWDKHPYNKFHNVEEMLYELNPDKPREIIQQFFESLNSEVNEWKSHTIRKGNRFKPGDLFKPCVWGNDINPKSGRKGPYHSQQIQFLPELLIPKTWPFHIYMGDYFRCPLVDNNFQGEELTLTQLIDVAHNDGLSVEDFELWFKAPKYDVLSCQIICWNESIEY